MRPEAMPNSPQRGRLQDDIAALLVALVEQEALPG
jgi:hypothetical protein